MSSQTSRGKVAIPTGELLSLIVVVVALLAVRGQGFDGLVSNDNVATLEYAAREVPEALGAGQRPGRFYWPPLYPSLVGLLAMVPVGIDVGTWARLVNGVALVLLLLGCFQLALSLGLRRRTGWFAAALVGAQALVWQSALTVAADLTALTFAVWAVVVLTGALRRLSAAGPGCSPWWSWPAVGLLMGAALLTRWSILGNGLLVLAAWTAGTWSLRGPESRRLLRRWLAWSLTAALLFAASAMLLAWFRASSRPAFGTLDSPFQAGWSLLNGLRSEFDGFEGRLRYEFPNLVYYAAASIHPALLGPFALLLPCGVWACWRGRDRVAGLVLVFWPASLLVFLSGLELQNPRFALMMTPALAVLAAHGGEWLWSLVAASGTPRARRIGRLAAAAACAALVFQLGFAWQRTGRLAATAGERAAVARRAAELLDQGATVLAFEVTPWIQWFSADPVARRKRLIELHTTSPVDAVARARGGRPALLVHDPLRVADQWSRMPAGRAITALQRSEDLGIVTLDRFGRWTIAEIRSQSGVPVEE